MATSTRGGMSGVPKKKRTPAPRTPPGLLLLAKESKAQRDLPKQKGINLHGVVPFIKETINPPQTTVKIHGKNVPVSGAPVLGRGTVALDLLRHGPEQVKHALDVGREIGAATKGKGKLPSDLDILMSGAIGFPRGGVREPGAPHPLSRPTAGAGIPVKKLALAQADESVLRGRLNTRLTTLNKTYNAMVERLIPEVSPYGGKLSKQE